MDASLESLRESFLAAASATRAHAFRSLLTALGVVIGVLSIVTTISIVQGLRRSIEAQFQGLGARSLIVSARVTAMDQLKNVAPRLTANDVAQVERRVEGIDAFTPILESVRPVSYRGRSTTTWVRGTRPSYEEVTASFAAAGRFIIEPDVKSRRGVCVIGAKVAEDLRLPRDPIGTSIQIGDEWFKVVGVMEKKGQRFGFSMDDFVIIPYSKADEAAAPERGSTIVMQLRVAETADLDAVRESIRRVLRQTRDLREGAEEDFKLETNDEALATFATLMNSVTVVFAGIVGISLVVGGIGIMNIMLVSVTERTREIGIRKALGAERRDILLQFLIEALLISGSAGILGLVLGIGLSQLVAFALPAVAQAYTPIWAIFLALGFSVATGVVFGMLPAIKASNLDPIIALQSE